MSWLYVISGAHPPQNHPHASPDWTSSTDNLYLAGGGNPDTSFRECATDGSSGWAVAGIGLRRINNTFSFLTKDDWRALLTQERFDPISLDGHFVVLRWKSGRLECFTDQLGLRTLYFASHDERVCLSTRLDWVAQTADRSQIDFQGLGSRWLLSNQVSYDSCVAGIDRLGPAGRAVFRDGETLDSSLYTPWLPRFNPGSASAAIDVLQDLLDCALTHHCTPSLGLSGGLDSRLLLALLAGNNSTRFVTHSFGSFLDPDVRIARDVTSALGFRHHHFDDPLPEISRFVEELRSFAAQAILSEPATSYLKLRYYHRLREAGRYMIDGGYGEFARRQYLNRVVKLGRLALQSLDAARLLPLMRSHRGDIFSKDVAGLLEEGARQSLDRALGEMPSIDTIGVENFADLLAVRYRLPNYGAPEQSRIDAHVLNFIPLVQPSFLRAVFDLPVKLRANASLHHDIIRKSCPALTHFPLVKSGFTYHFGLSGSMAWLTVRLKSSLAGGSSDRNPDVLLAHLREYVLDLLHSNDVRTAPLYDFPRLSDVVSRYYAGDLRLRGTVDWWLTFEMWRRSLSSRERYPLK